MYNNSNRKPATKAIAISRVSTVGQEDGYSIDAQKRRLEDYCARKGLELIKEFELIESSTVGSRKKFMEAIKFAEKQKETIAVVTDKVDRLQRGFKESPLLNRLIEHEKIELHFHVENCIIHKYSTSSEKLLWNMNVVVAQSYVDSLRDNVNRSIEQKLLSGEWITQAPIGYLHDRNERGKSTITVDRVRAPLVRRLFDEYAKGSSSLAGLVVKAKDWGLTNARGNQSYLRKAHIHSILQNPFYYGIMYYQKGKKYYPHIYEPIISKELFDECTAIREGHNKKPKWGGKEHLFRKLVTCATSGKIITAETKYRKRASGIIHEATYLGASDPNNPKKKVYINEDELTKEVELILKSMELSPESLAKITKYVKDTARMKEIIIRPVS